LDFGVFDVEGVVSEGVSEGLELEGFAEKWSFGAFLVVWVVVVVRGFVGGVDGHPSFEEEG